MLAGTPVKPPQLDEFFCANEAHLRARELAEIGLSEGGDLEELSDVQLQVPRFARDDM